MATKAKVQTAPANGTPSPLAWNIGQVAARLNLATITIRRLLARGKLRRIDGTRKVLIAEAELQRFVTQ
jgi:excisionase family DNA binding protein